MSAFDCHLVARNIFFFWQVQLEMKMIIKDLKSGVLDNVIIFI